MTGTGRLAVIVPVEWYDSFQGRDPAEVAMGMSADEAPDGETGEDWSQPMRRLRAARPPRGKR